MSLNTLFTGFGLEAYHYTVISLKKVVLVLGKEGKLVKEQHFFKDTDSLANEIHIMKFFVMVHLSKLRPLPPWERYTLSFRFPQSKI